MPEKVAEVKILTIEMECDKCGNGVMKRDGNITLCCCPPMYPHKCNNCGHIENYPFTYPYQKLVPLEQLREYTEDEV